MHQNTLDLLRHLASRPGHDEVKADFRQLLVGEFGVELSALDFERRVPEVRGRIDALIGRTVFEAKRDLTKEWADVERKMPDYLADREREERERFVGIASDGRLWAAFELVEGKLVKFKEAVLDPDAAEQFLAWLDGVVALKVSLSPDPLTIRAELGQEATAYRRALVSLEALWHALRADAAIALKRQLWAQLLKLVYGRDADTDSLWFQHTFLVIIAKCVAFAVVDLREDDPARLLSGDAFRASGIFGAVESDFFDWVVANEAGRGLVRRIMAHVRRFRLSEVDSDVLKILYESLIDRNERHGLGEYYTPDWLAAKVVRHAVASPLEQRVLDPACGSGTFLFHAIRAFLREAAAAGMSSDRKAAEACAHVAGMDIHPVAVIIARVTCILALAPALASRAGAVSIPVYLGDALQLSISEIIGGRELVIRVPPPPTAAGTSNPSASGGREQLSFPDVFCRDPALFDKAIERMRTGSETGIARSQIEAALQRITEQHYRADVTAEQVHAIRDLGETYITFDKLRRQKRDSVWAYVARNLSRPLALSTGGGWANVLVGNPPWVAYRHMSADLQKRFRDLASSEHAYVGGRFATQNDLCALFTVRASALYLRSGGRIGFILPMAALTRGQFERLRSGAFESAQIAWDEAWTMDDRLQPLFPVPACVVFGRRRALASPLPDTVRAYWGTLPLRDASEAMADQRLQMREGAPALAIAGSIGGSPYRKSFRDGATLYPRKLCLVERRSSGRLGSDLSAPFVVSRRSSQEKPPWRDLPGIENRVEAEFLHPVLLGESILPHRVWRPFEAVVPVTAKGEVLDAEAAANRGYEGLQAWMSKAEAAWRAHGPSRTTFVEQLDHYGKLSAQFPSHALRVVYAKAGVQAASCVVHDPTFVIDHKLYWHVPTSANEARYLAAVLNSETVRSRVEAYQSRGQWGARDFDKVIFNLPIPRFDGAERLHGDLAEAGAEAERLAAGVSIPETTRFQSARKRIREALADTGLSQRIDALVARLLDGA